MKKENEKPVDKPDGAQEEETREETPEEKSPRDRSFLANSLKTKSFSAAKNRQQNA